jgi:hypothetical protein
MFERLTSWWKKRREKEHESEVERALDEEGQTQSPGPGGWSPLGDLSKLSEDE